MRRCVTVTRIAEMNQPAKAPEPSMEEILASIRRIIADDDDAAAKNKTAEAPKIAEAPKPAPKPAPPPPAPAAPPAGAGNSQDDIDAMFASFDAAPEPEPPPPPPPPPPPKVEAPPAPDILDLTEAMESSEPPPFRRIEPAPDVVFREPPPSTIDHARRSFEERTEIDRSLLSPTTSAAVDSAFNSLANTVLVQNSRTLDDLVREMLRPMLKAWLDDNLPNMVERMVRAEIERVSRGRG
jgi:cell pole-organizing protein PopZ